MLSWRIVFLSLLIFVDVVWGGVTSDRSTNVCTRGKSKCRCFTGANSVLIIECVGNVSIPADILNVVYKLTLSGSIRITLLKEDDFNGLRNLNTLDLSNNKISNILPKTFDTLTSLVRMNLSGNHISFIPKGLFDNLYELEEIDLNGNKLTKIDANYFYHLPALQSIDLSDNSISNIIGDAFYSLPNIQTLNLRANPLYCDCEMKLFKEYVSVTNNLMLLDAECANYNNNSLFDVSNFGPSCTGSLFKTGLECLNCGTVKSHLTCSMSNRTCTSNIGERQPVCYSRIDYKGDQIMVTKGCQTHLNCILWSKENAQRCFNTTGDRECSFCCLGTQCNNEELGRRTKTMKFSTSVTLDRDLTPGLRNPSSQEYRNFKINVNNKLPGILQQSFTINGSYDVTLDSIVSPKTTLHLTLIWTSMKENDGALQQSSINSALRSTTQIEGLPVIVQSVSVSEIDERGTCPPDVTTETDSRKGTFFWPRTDLGQTSTIYCPTTARPQTAIRQCLNISGRAFWDTPDTQQCTDFVTTEQSPTSTTDISFTSLPTVITDANADQTASDLRQLSKDAGTFTRAEINDTVVRLEQLLSLTSTFSQDSRENNIAMTMDNLLDVTKSEFLSAENTFSSASRLLGSINKLMDSTNLSKGNFGDVGSNLALFASPVDVNSGIALGTNLSPGDDFQGSKVNVNTLGDVPDSSTSWIQIPVLLDAVPGVNKGNRFTLAAYKNSKLFDVIRDSMGTSTTTIPNNPVSVNTVNSIVLAANIPGVQVKDLKTPIKFRFKQLVQNAQNASCRFFVTNGSLMGTWSDEGCEVTKFIPGEYTDCTCDHLTNFALLMDVYGSGQKLENVLLKTLTYISYIGCGVSLLGLILTLLTYIMFRKLREKDPAKILINISLSLLAINLIFLLGQQNYVLSAPPDACKAVAIIMHYFLLSAFCWMLVQGYYMYRALVLVFDSHITGFLWKACLFGWGVPIVIVGITLGINSTDNYGSQGGIVCWLAPIPFYAAFVAPVSIILILNTIVFILVMRVIRKRATNSKLQKSQASSTSQQLRGAIVLVVLLGLTWTLAFIAIEEVTFPIQLCFTIFNGLQGFFIFIFHCVMKSDVRNHWKKKVYGDTQTDSRSTSKGTEEKYKLNATSNVDSKGQTDTKSKSISEFSDISKTGTDVTMRGKTNENIDKKKIQGYPPYSGTDS